MNKNSIKLRHLIIFSVTLLILFSAGVNSSLAAPHRPRAYDDNLDGTSFITVDQGATVTTSTSVLSNDTDSIPSHTLTAVYVSGPSHAASFSLNSNGTFTYTHDNTETSSDSFTYYANDGSKNSFSPATVYISINLENDPPVAVADSVTVIQNSPGQIINVLANDHDPDNLITTLKISALGACSHGTVSATPALPNGTTVTYIPTAGYIGPDSFTYTIKDPDGLTSTNTVTISVDLGPQPPTPANDTYTINEDSGANSFAVLTNDTDPNGDALVISAITQGTHGSVSTTPALPNGNTIIYTPAANFFGSDTFTYTVKDPGGLTATAVITVNITDVNDPPVATATDESITVGNGRTTSSLSSGATSLLANDTDVEGDTLAAVLVTNVTHGTLLLNSDGTFSYTHDGTATTSDFFTYRVFDGNAYSNTVTVSITISPNIHAVSGAVNNDFTSLPVNITDSVTPLVMINSSKDHQLFFKAYNDSSDLDSDGVADTTFKANIPYYGYFDSYKCYEYINNRFEPRALAQTTYIMDGTVSSFDIGGNLTVNITSLLQGTVGGGPYGNWKILDLDTGATSTSATSTTLVASGSKTFTTSGAWTAGGNVRISVDIPSYCEGSNDAYWSGNFLNWATMSRIDTIRKILFGGHRRVDTSSSTILERTYLPTDIHSFAKYYNGSDLAKLTPFTPNTTAPTGTSTSNVSIGTGSKSFTTQSGSWIKTGDYLSLVDHANSANYMKGWVTAFNSGTGALTVNITKIGGAGTKSAWDITNNTRTGLTFCNTTWNTSALSQDVTDPPLVRVAAGNYTFWSAGEVVQCAWQGASGTSSGQGSNYNNPETSGIPAAQSWPIPADVGSAPYGDFIVRIQACLPGLIGNEKCKLYPGADLTYGTADDVYKPIGLLQVYGDDDQLEFGMIAGTYAKHKSGGDLVSDIGSMSREINVNTDGTFKLVSTTVGGTANPSNDSKGIINAWNLYRIYGYKHGSWNYTLTSSGGDNCGVNYFGDVQESKCANWGNPFAEIFQTSLFYFGGENSPNEYQANDTTYINGLRYETGVWQDPLSASNYCAKLFVVNFNSSIISVDNDQLDTSAYGVQPTLGSSLLSDALTDIVGAGESIQGNNFFFGENGTDNNKQCTAKSVPGFGSVMGMCPEGPDLQGSYRIAGLAYYAHTNDIRPDNYPYNGNHNANGLAGTQKVDTFAVALSSGAPAIEIPVPGDTTGKKVTLLPACINNNRSNHGCTLVDFKILTPHSEVAGVGTGKFLAIWEDSLQGNDYDLDAGGIYQYTITSTQIQVSTAVTLENLGHAIGHGYIISGTTKDGMHIHSGTNGFNYTDPTGITGCSSCQGPQDGGGAITTATYTIGTSSAGLLKDPLWYAAKWGGFIDSNGNNQPDLVSEWDKEDNNTGNQISDGIPDNYFYATNPSQLEESLNRVFLKILQRTSSGTAAAVVSNNVRGEGALYQAYYEPQKKDTGGRVVDWIGTLHGLWLDSYGYLREDNGDATLGSYIDDPVIETYYDDTESRTRVKRWISTVPNSFVPGSPELIELGEIHPLWNARDQMNFVNLTDNAIASQRFYQTSSSSGRYIKTWIDSNLNGIVDTGEFIDFEETAITNSNYTFFDVSTLSEAQNLIRYLRGVEVPGYRNRTVDYNGDGTTEVIRLGDFINSTPTMAAAPAEGFDLLYRDNSYSLFRDQYHNRRNVLYAGANDGMLHAFNAGFFDPDNVRFTTTGLKFDGSAATAHPLGSELWAYVPMNLQPHLKWLKDPEYSHVYYVDGKPRIFDAKIFNNDATHPNGWGTLLVVGMRFGGGAITVDTGGDGLHADSNDKTRRSAYVIFDITDPESPPNLLAEIQPPDGTFTTVYPAVMTFKDKVANSPNKWFLVFGSGPNSLNTGENSGTAKLYVFDLDEITTPGQTLSSPASCTLATSGSTMQIISCDTGEANSFVGTPMVVDWNLDYKADALYFGTVGGVSSNQGRVFRLATGNSDNPPLWAGPDTLIDVAQPVFAPPTAAVDSTDLAIANKWIFFGTGRLIVNNDKTSTHTQSLYGVKDAGITIPINDLIDVTNVEVQSNGDLIWAPTAETGQDVLNRLNFSSVVKDTMQTYFDVLSSEMSRYACYDNNPTTSYFSSASSCDTACTAICSFRKGWKLDLPPITGTAGVAPATRMLTQQALLGEILFSSVYQPSDDFCASEGESRLYGISYKTGTALGATSVFGTEIYRDPITGLETSYTLNKRYIDLGFGMATSPAIHSGSGSGDSEVSVFTQLSTGTIIRQTATTEGNVRSGKKAWRER